MADKHPMALDVAEKQIDVFRKYVGDGLHISREALSRKIGIGSSTLKGWANGVTLPFWAIGVLRQHLPPEFFNELAEPGAFRIVDAEVEAANWDEIAATSAELTSDICRARKSGHISHRDEDRLKNEVRHLIAEAQAVVEGG